VVVNRAMDRMVSVYRQNELLFAKVKLAKTFGTKLRGLMFYRELPAIDGLLFYSCNCVHMFWMRFPLDLIFLSRDRQVLKTVKALAPSRLGPFVKDAYYVLETKAGMADEKNIEIDDRVWWQSTGVGEC
jgi:uncharacterized membrane protein (UPF0127 family)